MKEESGLSYASLTGATHSCGHDMHAAMLLGATTILKKHEDELKGMIIFMFQPDEEGITGAKGMMDAGILRDYKPDYAIAMHVNVREVPANHIWIKQDTIMASSDAFRVIVKGKGGHGAIQKQL